MRNFFGKACRIDPILCIVDSRKTELPVCRRYKVAEQRVRTDTVEEFPGPSSVEHLVDDVAESTGSSLWQARQQPTGQRHYQMWSQRIPPRPSAFVHSGDRARRVAHARLFASEERIAPEVRVSQAHKQVLNEQARAAIFATRKHQSDINRDGLQQEGIQAAFMGRQGRRPPLGVLRSRPEYWVSNSPLARRLPSGAAPVPAG
jgi:hypothetical protein